MKYLFCLSTLLIAVSLLILALVSHDSTIELNALAAPSAEYWGRAGGTMYALAWDDPYIYIGVGPDLVVLNREDSFTMTHVATAGGWLTGCVRSISLSGNYVYVAAAESGLQVLENWSVVGNLGTPGIANQVIVSGTVAYVADTESGLRIIDVSDPSHPTEIGAYDTPGYAQRMYISGTLAYIADASMGLRVIDIQDPTMPTEIGSYTSDFYVYDVLALGTTVYLASSSGLRIVDASDPTNPAEVAFDDIAEYGHRLLLDGKQLYMVGGATIYRWSVYNPTNPIFQMNEAILETPEATDFAIIDDVAYVTSRRGGLWATDLAPMLGPGPELIYDAPGYAWGVDVMGTTAYVAEGQHLRVFDVSEGGHFSETSRLRFNTWVLDVALQDTVAYVAGSWQGLRVVDISDPTAPVKVGQYNAVNTRKVVVADTTAYVTDSGGGLVILDVSQPISPVQLGTYDAVTTVMGIHIEGSQAYLAALDKGLWIVDISDPANPATLGSYDTPGYAEEVVVNNNLAYVADLDGGLRIVDVNDPANPNEVGVYSHTTDALNVTYHEGYVYLAAGRDGVHRVDVLNPSTPASFSTYDSPGRVQDIVVANGTIHIADGDGGFAVMPEPNLIFTRYKVSGQVFEEDGSPIAGVTLTDGAGHTASTNASGTYTLTGIYTGTYIIDPTKPGYVFTPTTRVVTVPPDQTGVDFVGVPGIERPLTAVSIVGPAQGHAGAPLRFAAPVLPQDASSPLSYTWDFGDSTLAQGSAVTHTYIASGTYTINLWATNGVMVTDTFQVDITAPQAPAMGDSYEVDNDCTQASVMSTTGVAQIHTFHEPGDTDWVKFTAARDRFYVVEARVPATSTADVNVEIYDDCGAVTPNDEQSPTFSSDVRLGYSVATTATHYIRLRHHTPQVYGTDAVYHLSVKEKTTGDVQGHVIIVAGRMKEQDAVQDNIHHVTNAVYQLARENGCGDEDITYLAHDQTLNGVDAPATSANLRQAIANAVGHVGPEKPLTLYLMDHGGEGTFYLDKGDSLTPETLDTWLAMLQSTWLNDVSVVLDACHSGSFIQQRSPSAHMLVASTKAQQLAYASEQGAIFSDAFIGALRQGATLEQAYKEGNWAAEMTHPQQQQPQVDGDGDGLANEPADHAALAGRTFACYTPQAQAQWAPYIAGWGHRFTSVDEINVWAEVRDDEQVSDIWAEVYAPSYQLPEDTETLVQTHVPTLTLQATTIPNIYRANVQLQDVGDYRIVLYARDNEGLSARPKEIQVTMKIQRIYLPLTLRTS